MQRAIQTLIDTEAALKRLIGEAADSGDYSSVETLARWAGKVEAIHSEEKPRIQQHEPPEVAPSAAPDVASLTTVSKRKVAPKTSRHSKRRAYPKFAKSGDVLFKIGWSKSSKSEYQHKSPRMVAKILADSLVHHARSGAIVSMDDVLPLKAHDDSDIPDYQVYVSLAWLRYIGVVKQNGRQGYTVETPDELLQQIDTAWSTLPDVKVNTSST